MPSQSHLRRRGTRWYWRRRVPQSLVGAFGRAELIHSLLTGNRDIALRLARRLDVAVDTLFEKATRSLSNLSSEQFSRCINDIVELELGHLEAQRAADRDMTHEHAVDLFDASLADAENCKISLMQNDITMVEPLMAEIAGRRGLSIDRESAEWVALGRATLRALAQAYRRDALRCAGEYEEDRETPLPLIAPWQRASTPVVVAPSPAPPIVVPPLGTFLEKWIASKRKTRKFAPQTEKAARGSVNLFMRIAGDRALPDYTRLDIEACHDTLEKLPNNHGKSPKHLDMSIDEVIALRDDETLTLSRNSLDFHWGRITAFIEWTYTQLPEGAPMVDLLRLFSKLEWSGDVPDAESRLPWDDASLHKLIMSPIWTGCAYDPERRYWRHEPGPDVIRDEFWWLPPLAILHGGRMEEYCFLTGDDVVDIDGIPVMDITKGLKTGSSERVVPVNQTAIECGFLDLAARAGSGRLFPLMTPGGPFQKYSWIYSERYTDYRRRIGVYRPLMDFHSHRTSAATRIVNAAGSDGKAVLLADEITGHDSRARQDVKELQSVTLDYLAGSELAARRDAVNSITFLQKYNHLRAKPGFLKTTGKERGAQIRERLAQRRKKKR